MLKYFRKVRQDLLSERNIGQYIRYVFGEIALIVIGILIAVQIRNWNEEWINNKQEQKILYNLKQDFEYNLVALHDVKAINAERIDLIKETLNHTGVRYSENFDIDPVLDKISTSVYYYPKTGLLSELINSGNLETIRNNDLRNQLTSWIPKLDDLNRRQDANRKFENQIISYVIENGSWLDADENTSDETIKKLNLPPSGFDVDNNELLKSIEFENMIENQAVFLAFLDQRLLKCQELNHQILKLLEYELEQ